VGSVFQKMEADRRQMFLSLLVGVVEVVVVFP
jgi:hypothetical protein